MRALLVDSELSACSIRRILLADVCADLLQFEPDGRYGIPAGPEMFARKVSLFAVEPSDSYGALPLQKPDHGRYRVLGSSGVTSKPAIEGHFKTGQRT